MFYDPEYGLFFVKVACTFEKILFSAVAGWMDGLSKRIMKTLVLL